MLLLLTVVGGVWIQYVAPYTYCTFFKMKNVFFFKNVSLNNFSMYCSCMQQNLAKTIFLPGLPRVSCTTATHQQCSEDWNKFTFVKSDRGQLPAPSQGKKPPLGEYPWVCDEKQTKKKTLHTHTHTVSGAVQGLYLLELQGNQPVNHHISKCTSLTNHHIHSFMARVNWCMTDSLRLCSLFAISQVRLKEHFRTKKTVWRCD